MLVAREVTPSDTVEAQPWDRMLDALNAQSQAVLAAVKGNGKGKGKGKGWGNGGGKDDKNKDPKKGTWKGKGKGKDRGKGRDWDRTEQARKCSHCGRGHEVENCWELDPDKAPSWFRKKQTDNKRQAPALETGAPPPKRQKRT